MKTDYFCPEIQVLRKLPENTVGRDFVVGDLHGCKTLLDKLLREIDFNYASDRLFLVGDLADRGEDSIGCLRLLEQPWCYAVMGNHEELMLGAFWRELNRDKPIPAFFYGDMEDFLVNGGQWAIGHLITIDDEFKRLLNLVANLPQVIVVGEGEKRFNIVHAEFPEHYTDKEIDLLPSSVNVNFYDEPGLRWKRSLMMDIEYSNGNIPEKKPGLSTTYTGHTIGKGVRRIYSHVCLDTGGFMSKEHKYFCLTMIEAATNKVYTAK